MPRTSRAAVLACICAVAAGCVPSLSQNPPREANRALPASYQGGLTATAETAPSTPSAARLTWAQFFSDAQLRTLIEAALKNNRELNMRLQEIIIAENEVMARQGEYLPRLGITAGAGLDRVGKYTSQGRSDEANGVPNPLQDYQLGFRASWEVDIWKRLRNAAKAASFRYLASIEGKNFMVTRLVAEIAASYYELMALDRQLEVLKQNIEIQENALKVVKLQKEAARVTQLAVQRFEAEVLKNQSRRYALEQQIVETENRINFLVGRLPQPIARSSSGLEAPLPSNIDAGLPSQLLENRPDIKEAELQLRAAKLDVKAARARFYPSLSIEAGVGYAAFNPKHLFATPESTVFNLAGNLVAPLLNRQAIKAEYYTANAEQLRAVFNYEQTLLSAFTEVANQLSLISKLQESYRLESQQVDTLVDAVAVSNVLFQSARADYMEVLLTRRDALESQMDLIETRLKQRQALIHVYQALGGGWR